MTARAPALFRLAAAALALALGGCVTLLPKQKASDLYRFGATPASAEAPAQAPAAERIGVYRAGGLFQRETAGDRILTITGDRAAYIAEARWVAPAEALFDEAVLHAFDAWTGRVRLIARGEPAKADFSLRLDVRNFETHYRGDEPTVVVRVRAVVLRNAGRTEVADRIFEVETPAAQNRVHAIVAAYDTAVSQLLKDLVPWVESSVG
jgi:cholesterol transport system auxiliary component